MRKIACAILFCGILFIGVFSCSKDSSKSSAGVPPGTTTTLDLSGSIIAKGQPLIATLPSGVSASNIHWTVTPASTVHISPGNGQAVVLFAQSGNYQVTASYLGADSATMDSSVAPITVTDSIYSPPPAVTYDTFAVTGDQVVLTPISDSASQLVFLAQTVKSYPCYSYFLYSYSSGAVGDAGISIQLSQAVSAGIGNCNGSTSPVSSYLFVITPQNAYPNGDYPLSVTLNGITYQGSVTITDSNYTFNWGYTSGVMIQPLQVKR